VDVPLLVFVVLVPAPALITTSPPVPPDCSELLPARTITLPPCRPVVAPTVTAMSPPVPLALVPVAITTDPDDPTWLVPEAMKISPERPAAVSAEPIMIAPLPFTPGPDRMSTAPPTPLAPRASPACKRT
jgi:hypothetical protein